MITIDNLKALTKPSVSLKGRDNLILKLASDLAMTSIIEVLEDYFSRSEKQKVIKVIFDENEFGYLTRTDFMTSVIPTSTRAVGGHDGATLQGNPTGVKFIELCCSFYGCKKHVLVTSYDKDDPPYCADHMTLMKPCDET